MSSSEIVVADPPIEPNSTVTEQPTHALTRSLTFGHGDGNGPEPFDSERLPPTLAREIQRFLRVANLIESEEPRIAYLCKPFELCFLWFLVLTLTLVLCLKGLVSEFLLVGMFNLGFVCRR